MTIRYKADHTKRVEVTEVPFCGNPSWVGVHHEIYTSIHWEPVPETRWVPCNVVQDDIGMFSVDGIYHIKLQGINATVQPDGTVRFEREE